MRFAGGDLEFRNADKVLRRHLHDALNLRTDQRSAQRSHRAFAVDDGGYAKFFVHVSGLPKSGQFARSDGVLQKIACRSEQPAWRECGGGECGDGAEETTTIPAHDSFAY